MNSGNEILENSSIKPMIHRVLWSIAVLAFCITSLRSAPAQERTSSAPDRQAALNDLTAQLSIGTEFFLNRTETKGSIEKHFRIMHENGLTLARIFVIWDDIERTPGNWDFQKYDWIYDAAAKNGIKIAATLCSEDPPGWKQRTPFYHHYTNLDNAEYRADAAVYLDKVVSRYKTHPAQGIWLLMNEPNKYDTDAATFAAFGRWLRKKYGSLDELNKHWFRPQASFSSVTITPEQLSAYWTDPRAYVDWKEFNVDNLIDELLWIRGRVLAIDPNHPIHFNVTRPVGDAEGQDVWKEKPIPDILGFSIHAAAAFPVDTPENEFGERYAYRLDLIANASQSDPAKPFWVTELQSGPTLYTARSPLTIMPQDLSRWMWDSYGAGSKAVIFWLWHPRDIGTEGGEWGLVSADGSPSARLPAVKAVADVLRGNPSLAKAHPQPARVAILYNREANIVNNFDGRKQGRQGEVEESLFGCYLALLRAHIPSQFVDLDQLKKGEVNKFSVLYAPDSYAIDDRGLAALKDYVKQGGTLWADGLLAWKTETTQVRPTVPGGLTDLTGVEASDIYPVQAARPYSVTAHNELGGELWKLPLQLKGAQVVLRDNDGNPFAVRHSFGKGVVYYFSSAVTLAYARRGNPIVQQWIVEPAAGEKEKMPVQLIEARDKVIFRGLIGTEGPVAILSNWGETQKVVVGFEGLRKVRNAVSGEMLQATTDQGMTLATLTLTAGSSALLVTE
jgi:beta-galactosidase